MGLHFESPLESLVLRYPGDIAGYLWTCLALLAAGIGLWRFRLLGSGSRSTRSTAAKSPTAVVPPAIPPPLRTSDPITSTMIVSDFGECEESGTSTKGRFTAFYFLAEEDIRGGDKGDECEWGSSYDCGGAGECLDMLDWGWRGDLGWYSYQDWKAINGSVVRLWDGGRRGHHRRLW